MYKLKKCPSCSYDAAIAGKDPTTGRWNFNLWLCYVRCWNCYFQTNRYRSKKKAAGEWNQVQ